MVPPEGYGVGPIEGGFTGGDVTGSDVAGGDVAGGDVAGGLDGVCTLSIERRTKVRSQ